MEFFKWPLWQEAFQEAGLDMSFYTRARGLDELLPWDHIDLGLPKEDLGREYQQALAEPKETAT